MKMAVLTRERFTDEGVFGTLTAGPLQLCTLELPWRDSDGDGIGDPQKSCITPGTYELEWYNSPSKGWCYLVKNVKQRSNILIHSANFAGDVDKGWQSQLLGCIALGLNEGVMPNDKGRAQHVVTSSKAACQKFYDWGLTGPISLTIRGA